jgi:hypothetical protein
MKRHGVSLLKAVLPGLLALLSATPGCANQDDTTDTAEGRAEAGAAFTRLDTATPSDVTKIYQAIFNRELDQAFACHPEITAVSRATLNALTECEPTVYADLRATLSTLLGDMGMDSATSDQLKGRATTWVQTRLSSIIDSKGDVDPSQIPQGYLSTALRISREQNAFLRARQPDGINLQALSRLWDGVRFGQNSFAGFIYPASADREPSVADITRQFTPKGEFLSEGLQAIDDFARAAAHDSPNFEQVAEILRKPSIKKRYFFADSTNNTGAASLFLVDQFNQVYGLWYSTTPP